MTCILANSAWIFTKILLGILYHKLSLFMLIRRSAGYFKCYFQIFVNLQKFFIMAMAPCMVSSNRGVTSVVILAEGIGS